MPRVQTELRTQDAEASEVELKGCFILSDNHGLSDINEPVSVAMLNCRQGVKAYA